MPLSAWKLSAAFSMILSALVFLVFTGNSVSAQPFIKWPGYFQIYTANKPREVKWLFVKCTFSDEREIRLLPPGLNPAIKDLDNYIKLFLTTDGAGLGNVTDYYDDVSYGAISFSGSRVVGWYPAPFSHNSTLDRTTRVQQCADSISHEEAATIKFDDYYGVVLITNDLQDGGACYDGQQQMTVLGNNYNLACVVFDPGSLWTAFASHELGHGLGFEHSWDTTPCEYCDQYDVMSAMTTRQFNNPNFNPTAAEANDLAPGYQSGGAGPGLNVPNLLFLGVIPVSRLVTYKVGAPSQIFTIAALSHPQANAPLAVKIVGSNPKNIYTVEYRQTDGWDQGLPENAVMIHEYKIGSDPYSYLQEGPTGTNGEWTVGATWQDGNLGVLVTVANIDTGTGIATVAIGPSCPNCPVAPKCIASTNCLGVVDISCTGKDVGITFNGNCRTPAAEPIKCIAGFNGASSISNGGNVAWMGSTTSPNDAQACTVNSVGETCITVIAAAAPLSCALNIPPDAPSCGEGEKWCTKFAPPRCAPATECLVDPARPPPP